jgi:protein subunit release factor B
MTQPSSDREQLKNSNGQWDSLAAELQREVEKLRQLAADLKAREEAEAEMRTNYPVFKQVVYALLREQFEREVPPLPDDVDLETYASREGAVPLDAFLEDLEAELNQGKADA